MIRNQRGITFVEILIVLGILLILLTFIMVTIDPISLQKRGRDNKRLSDLSVLERIIGEYLLDAGSYPDTLDTTRTSISLPLGNLGPLESSIDGWIDQNLSAYEVKLPLDPINDSTYNYSYRHSASGFEINTVLEYYTDKMTEDGGNNDAVYEIGNDLTIF